MKTPEEIRLAVLKECERLTASVPVRAWVYPLWQDQEYRPSVGVMRASYSGEIPVFGCIFFFKEFAVSDAILTGNPELTLAIYRLLNLEAKELEEMLANANNSFLCQMAENVVLEERAQELVELAEHCAKWFGGKTLGNTAITALNQWKGGGNG